MPIFLSDSWTISKINTFSPDSFSYGVPQVEWSVENDVHNFLALISYNNVLLVVGGLKELTIITLIIF